MNLGTLGEKTEPSKTAFVSLADGIHYTYADLQMDSFENSQIDEAMKHLL